MGDKSIQFFDNHTKTNKHIKCVNNGDGTYSLAVTTDAPDSDLTYFDNKTRTDLRLGVKDLGDGTFALCVASV